MVYKSTKTYGHSAGLSCAFRQWRADSHCSHLHGYPLSIKFVFVANELDACNWVMDFGGLKSLKAWLDDLLDHKTLVAYDDPELSTFRMLHDRKIIDLREIPATGCEALANFIYRYTTQWLLGTKHTPRCWLESVEVREHEGNSAVFEGVSL